MVSERSSCVFSWLAVVRPTGVLSDETTCDPPKSLFFSVFQGEARHGPPAEGSFSLPKRRSDGECSVLSFECELEVRSKTDPGSAELLTEG